MVHCARSPRPAPCLGILLFLWGWAAPGFVPSAGAAHDPEDILGRSIAALGGEEAWAAIKSLQITGLHTSFSMTQPFRLLRQRPNLYRFDFYEGHLGITLAHDGATAWWKTENPIISKATWPAETPTPHTRALRLDAEFDPPILGHRQKGHEIHYIGPSKFEGEPFLELEITRRDGVKAEGSVERWFLDPQTLRPALRVSEGTYHGYYTEQRQHFLDYREVAGVQMPHRVETQVGNDFLELEIEKVVVNGGLDEGLFRRPLPVGMKHLAGLTGGWRVEIENMDNPAFHPERPPQWETHPTRSRIESLHGGSLLREEISITTPRPRRLTRSWTYDRFQDVYRVGSFDTFTEHLDVLEGRMNEAGRLVLTNLRTGTAGKVGEATVHVREILFDLGGNSFRLDRETSIDGGENWRPELRCTYTLDP